MHIISECTGMLYCQANWRALYYKAGSYIHTYIHTLGSILQYILGRVVAASKGRLFEMWIICWQCLKHVQSNLPDTVNRIALDHHKH